MKNKIAFLILLLSLSMFINCGGENNTVTENDSSEVPSNEIATTVNWNTLPNGSYTKTQAKKDLGNISAWNDSRAAIVDETLRIKLVANSLSNAGIIAKWDIENANTYEISYDILFDSNFEWSKGGKCGFGFQLGDGNTGGDPAWDGNGGSMRMMWYTNSQGRTTLRPYVYYKDQPTEFGDTFNTYYPLTGNLQKNQWYSVKIRVKSNTNDNTDGSVFMSINDVVLISQDIRWTTNKSKSEINKITFTTFRGGSTDEWKSNQDNYIYYDNLSYKTLE